MSLLQSILNMQDNHKKFVMNNDYGPPLPPRGGICKVQKIIKEKKVINKLRDYHLGYFFSFSLFLKIQFGSSLLCSLCVCVICFLFYILS